MVDQVWRSSLGTKYPEPEPYFVLSSKKQSCSITTARRRRPRARRPVFGVRFGDRFGDRFAAAKTREARLADSNPRVQKQADVATNYTTSANFATYTRTLGVHSKQQAALTRRTASRPAVGANTQAAPPWVHSKPPLRGCKHASRPIGVHNNKPPRARPAIPMHGYAHQTEHC